MINTVLEHKIMRVAPQIPTAAALQTDVRWLTQPEHLHLRFQQLKSGSAAALHVLPFDDKGGYAVAVGDGHEWAVALSQASSVNTRRAAPQIARFLPAGSYLTAPVNLASSVSRAWAEINDAPTGLVAHDACLVMHQPKLPRAPRNLPLVLASELGREKAAEEMAFCWLSVKNQPVPVSEFQKVLGYADAVLWRQPQGPTESFRVFTELAPQSSTSPRHILMGVSCGKGEHMPFTFSYLAHQRGKVIALVGSENTAHMELLENTGFERKRGLTLATYRLG